MLRAILLLFVLNVVVALFTLGLFTIARLLGIFESWNILTFALYIMSCYVVNRISFCFIEDYFSYR